MSTLTSSRAIQAQARTDKRKSSINAGRAAGMIPAVIYGAKETPLSVAINGHDLLKVRQEGGFYTKIHTVEVDGKKHQVLARDIQRHVVMDHPIHVDFMRYEPKRQVKVTVPVHIINENDSPGLKKGGVLQVVRPEIDFRCRADNIPSYIEASLAGKDVTDSVHISEVALPDGASPVEKHNFTIATIVSTRSSTMADLEADSADAAAAAPDADADEEKKDEE